MKCSMCMGLYVGMFVFLSFWFSGIQMFPNLYFGTFFFGCISSAVCFGLTSLINDDGLNINIK